MIAEVCSERYFSLSKPMRKDMFPSFHSGQESEKEIKTLDLEMNLYTILQILSVTLFEKRPILQAFSDEIYINQHNDTYNQLKLFS
jgi:hypothetical protein